MYSLKDVLKQTLLFTSKTQPKDMSASFSMAPLPGGRPDVTLSSEEVSARLKQLRGKMPAGGFPMMGSPASVIRGTSIDLALQDSVIKEVIQKRPLWEYELAGLDGIKNLTARHRTMGDMPMPVCKQVKWSPVKVMYKGKELLLKLESKFLLKTYFLGEGEVPEASKGYWQLPMNLDKSFMRVFGYQLAGDGLKPIDQKLLDSPFFMFAPPNVGPSAKVSSSGGNVQVSPPLQVLVCMCFGTGMERNDFEPGGLLGAAKLLPHFMLMANLPVESMEASITLERKPTTPHTVMDEGREHMTEQLGMGLYTDRNDILPPAPAPYWDDLFEYYWIDPGPGTEIKAVCRERNQIRDRAPDDSNPVTLRDLDSRWKDGWKFWDEELVYEHRAVKKYPRQGEFDNIHIAPKMKLPASVVKKLPASWPASVREVSAMAPFCVHDCLHTHWRWGRMKLVSAKWTYGWNGDVPYKEPGAPMVPPNQDVTLKLLGASGFTYTAKVHAPAGGRWQIIMHHGSAYALSYENEANLMMGGSDAFDPDLPGKEGDKGQWALFYWRLRYHFVDKDGSPDQYFERLRWNAQELKKARDL
jgi:hypothetical protein